MQKAFAICVTLKVVVFLSLCSAQAPGDEDDRCTVDHTSPQVYPDTVRNLMDSYNYEQLLPGNGTGNPVIQGAVWNDRSYDGNDETDRNSPTYWQHGAGGICRYQTTVCGWRREGALQNNWLFTQHIHKDFDPNIYNYPVEIHVEITHALKSCRERLGCNPRVYVHNYITNTMQIPSTEGDGFMNTQHHTELGVLHPDVVSLTFVVTLNFTLQPSQTGFYIAFKDNGTCFGISRVQVYRDNCKSFQSGLVLYPDAPAPVSDSVNINIQCVDNAVVSGSARVTCGSDGRWGPQNPVCQCHLGYEDRGTECVACPAGEYRSAVDSTCQQCPDNTVRDQVAAPLCECLDGYFRTSTEPASKECTQPPSAPNIVSLTAQPRSIIIRWTRPAELGGRSDLFYEVLQSDPDQSGVFMDIPTNPDGGSTSFTLTGLRPYTQYCVRVIAHNGVSDQDPDGTHLRTVEECVRTDEDQSCAVIDLQSVFPIVLWKVPDEPNGVIINYQLTFTRDDKIKTFSTESDQTHFIIAADTLPGSTGTFTVEVRARNGAPELGKSDCKLTVDPAERSLEPTRCVVCPEKIVGLVRYPATPVPTDGSVVTVSTQCVENAEQSSPSLSVTCTSSGEWGSENPECTCMDDYMLDIEAGVCGGPPPLPGVCSTCPENITIAIDDTCTEAFIIWTPVNGAQQYSLQLQQDGDTFHSETVNQPNYKIDLSNQLFKDKTFSIEIGAVFGSEEVSEYSKPFQVNSEELIENCRSDPSSTEGIDPLVLCIAVVVTFVLTAAAVSFLAVVIGLVVNGRKSKKARMKNATNMAYLDQAPINEKEKEEW